MPGTRFNPNGSPGEGWPPSFTLVLIYTDEGAVDFASWCMDRNGDITWYDHHNDCYEDGLSDGTITWCPLPAQPGETIVETEE